MLHQLIHRDRYQHYLWDMHLRIPHVLPAYPMLEIPPCHGDEFFDPRMCHFFERGRCLKANESLCETVGGRMQETGLMPRNPRYGSGLTEKRLNVS